MGEVRISFLRHPQRWGGRREGEKGGSSTSTGRRPTAAAAVDGRTQGRCQRMGRGRSAEEST